MTDAEQSILDSLPRMRNAGDLDAVVGVLPENAVVAELGSFAGESALQFLESGKIAKLICVDQWIGGYDDKLDTASRSDMRVAKQAFDIRVKAYRANNVYVLPMSTVGAATMVARESLDMVYIDASHRYEDVLEDLRSWIPKVKVGGWIAGHDYARQFPGVIRAVHGILGMPDWTSADSSWVKRKVA